MKIFKTLFKNIYRYLIKNLFFIIYGKVNYSKNSYNNVIINSLNHSKVKKFNNTNYKIFKIKNGRVCTDGVEQVAYISEKNIIKEISYTQIKGKLVSARSNFVVKKGTPYFLKKIDGNVLSLIQGASGNSNYFHWMFDILPKIKIISLCYNFKEIDFIYMPKLHDFQKKTLKKIGLKNIKFIDSNKYKHLLAKNLIVPEHPWYFKGKIAQEAQKLPTWIIKWIRSLFIKNLNNNLKIKKIFIDRSESQYDHCKLINNNQIISELKKKGFKIFQVGKLSLESQVSLFNNANIIIGPHGAAFTNLVFCKPGTKVIEIKPKDRPQNYRVISGINKLKYNQIILPTLKNKNSNGDMYVSPRKLLNYL